MNTNRLKQYYYLTKPGIIRGNMMVAIAAFLFASQGGINISRLLAMTSGLGLIIASGCVFNNYLDRTIDKQMKRTQKRALVTGEITTLSALVYGTALGLIGSLLLLVWVNVISFMVAAVGFIFYVFVYAVAKRASTYGTVVGAIPGAVPPVVGYVAVSGAFNVESSVLFAILFVWQMPHFYAISIFRAKDYAAANIPVMAVKRGASEARRQIMVYVVLFAIISPLLAVLGRAGLIYLVVMAGLSVLWLSTGIRAWKQDDDKWGKAMFGASLLVLTVFSLLIAIEAWLP